MSRTTVLAVGVGTPVSSSGQFLWRPSAVGCAVVGLGALVVLLAALEVLVGVGVTSWAVGLGCGGALVTLLLRALAGAGRDALGPADTVTLGRGLMACGVAALTLESLLGHHVTPALLALSVPALALDAVDGVVARRTGTVSAIGGRFDGEVDAFLILVLSVAAAPSVGWWVLAGGLARYAFGLAGWALPWMRGALDFRYWRKVVTAVVGVVLTLAVTDLQPRWPTLGAVAVAHLLLAESFGRDVWTLWTRRPRVDRRAASSGRSMRLIRSVTGAFASLLAVAILWFALVAPNQPDQLTPVAFLRLPVEVVAAAAVVLVAPARWRRAVALVLGSLLGGVALLKLLDLAVFTVLARPYNVVTDRGLLGSGLAFVRDSWGSWAAAASVAVVASLAAVGFMGPVWAVARLSKAFAGSRRQCSRAVLVLTAAWVLCAVSGLQFAAGTPVAFNGVTPFVAGKIKAGATAYRDGDQFDRALAVDAFRFPASADLSGLAGKDVVVVFVESYGRVAVEGTGSEPVQALLDAWAGRLSATGVSARSGYLTSSTFGGSSWLAHATLQSGLSVDDQARYDRLLEMDRTTLTSAFSRQGWRTVAVLPSTHGSWPEGKAFYGFDEVYARSDLGYKGPTFGFSAVPDQFALSAFSRRELAAGRSQPVMAEVELTSSHGPWAPLPTMVDEASLGDGSGYVAMRNEAVTAAELWSDRASVPAAYRTSIAYSLTSALSLMERRTDDDLVLVLLGDHQPATIVSGFGGNRDVPISIIAADPQVLDQISGWGWTDGLRPDGSSPVWPMADFRDRFLSAFSTAGGGAETGGAETGGRQ